MHKLQKFLSLSLRHKILLVQAWCMLGGYRAAILCVSFKRLTRKLHHEPAAIVPTELPFAQHEQAIAIGRIVAAASRITPWQSACLAQVLVVQRLLVARNIPGQFFLGVRSGSEQPNDAPGLSAHAWLQCGNHIVNGASGHQHFTVVSSFSWGGQHG